MIEYERLLRLGVALIAGGLCLLLFGCAGYKVNDDGSVETYGVMRTLTVKKEYYENGGIKSHVISTDSTTKDALLGINEIFDSAINTASKLKP